MVRPFRVALVRSTVAFLGAVLALLAGACGSSEPTLTASVKLAATTMISDTWPLPDHVVTPAALPGLDLLERPSIVSRPSAWAAAVERSPSPAREAARLRGLGFLRGVDEQLRGRFPLMAQAISIVEQYRTTAGARAELAYQYAQLERSPGVKRSAFAVGIPAAHGVRVAGGGIVGLNVLFTVGQYYYAVAAGYPAHAPGAPTTARVVAAARTLYLAVTGCSAPAR
jgi:hypothetical protein